MSKIWMKPSFYLSSFAACAIMALTAGCASGGFKLTRQYARWVNSQNIILRIVIYILTSVVFAVTMLIDFVIFNTLDFWNGTVAAGSYEFKDGDKLFQERNLHGKVTTIAGFKVAGLGGVFRGQIWNPDGEEVPEIRNWQALVSSQNAKRPNRQRFEHPTIEQISRDGLLRTHSSTIFYDDWLNLYGQQADILVSHEAPDCHQHGFKAMTGLAQSMRVKWAFHGHHHQHRNYSEHTAQLGFLAFSVGFMSIVDQYGGQLTK